LITLLDADTARPILTEEMRFGIRVAIVVLPAHPHYRSAEALKDVGPQAFGYSELEYSPCGPFVEPVPLLKFSGGIISINE